MNELANPHLSLSSLSFSLSLSRYKILHMEQTRYATATGNASGKTPGSTMINAPSKTRSAVTNDPGTTQSTSRMNRSTSDGSPITRSPVKRRDKAFLMASKETSKAFKKKKSSSFPSESGVLPRSDPMMGDTGSSSSSITGRPRLASESHDNMDHSTIKLLQNLTSLIVCARSTSLLPHTSTVSTSSTAATAEGAQTQSGPPPITIPTTNLPKAKLEHCQCTRGSSLQDDSLQVELTMESADNDPLPDSSDFYDSPSQDGGSEDMEMCQEPASIPAQVLDTSTTATHQALSNKKSNTKQESRESQDCAGFGSTTMVSSPEKKKIDRSGATLLPFSECVSGGGGDVNLVSQITRIQGLVNTITNSNKLESSYSDLCLPTDHLEQQQKTTKKASETKILKSTHPTATGLAPDKTQNWLCEAGELNRAGSDYCCQEPQPTPTNTPQEFNQGRPQEFNQRSLQGPLLEGCTCTENSSSNKELCSTAPGYTSSAPLSLREESGRVEVESLQSLKKLQSSSKPAAVTTASSASLSLHESSLDKEKVESSQEVCPVAVVDSDAVALSLPTFEERLTFKGDSKAEPCSSVTITGGAATPHLSLSHSKERFVESSSETDHSATDKGVHSTTATTARGGTVPPVSLLEHSKDRLSSKGEVEHSVQTDSNKEEPCSTATVATIGTGSLSVSGSNKRLGEGGEECSEARKEELCRTSAVPIVATPSPPLSKEEQEKSDIKGEVPVGCLETNQEHFSVAFLVSDLTGQVEVSPASSAVPEQRSAHTPHLVTGNGDGGAVLNLTQYVTLQEVNMSRHQTERCAKRGYSYDGDIIVSNSQSRSDPQLQLELGHCSDESNRTESIAGQRQSSNQQDIWDSIGEPSQLQQEGWFVSERGERERECQFLLHVMCYAWSLFGVKGTK